MVQERAKLAAALKKKGNDYYQKESFELAAEFYTRAINVSPTEEPVYYSNRGACECAGSSASGGVLTTNKGYMNMKPPKFELIIEDCDKAISLNKDYVKAINRRANALEALDRLEEALRGQLHFFHAVSSDIYIQNVDYTAATILDGFQNEKAAQAVERVLKKLSSTKAAEIIKVRISCSSHPIRVDQFHRPVIHTSPRIPLSLRISQHSVVALFHRCQKTQHSRIMH